jgi:hypothetical protein
MLQNYPQDILDLFLNAIKGNQKAFKSLMKTNPELAAFSDAIIKGSEQAEMWLKARVGMDWWLMCRALDHDKIALKKLQEKDSKFDVSFVLACHNRVEGKYWLAKNGYERFFPICEAIVEAFHAEGWEDTMKYLGYKSFG